MSSILKFSKLYFGLAVLILTVEILIAKFAHDRIIRPYFGDVLVVVLIYCFVKSFLDTPVLPAAIGVLLFAFTIEILQYLKLIDRLGLKDSKIAATIIGTSFEWFDIIAYITGIAAVLFFEKNVPGKRGSMGTN